MSSQGEHAAGLRMTKQKLYCLLQILVLIGMRPLWSQDAMPYRVQDQTSSTAAAVPSPTATPTALPSLNKSEASGQASSSITEPVSSGPVHSKRILWVIPNYRTVEEDSPERLPLSARQKFKTAVLDSFDFSSVLVAGFFGGVSMAEGQYRDFGVGAQGFGKYFGAAFADQAVGNFMTEAILPSMLHQDPQYYTKAHGGFWKRTGYAMSREVITFGDSGHKQFNTSEILGNAIAAGISNTYYPPRERSVSNTIGKWSQQVATDAFFNVLKEFWPDVRKKMFGK